MGWKGTGLVCDLTIPLSGGAALMGLRYPKGRNGMSDAVRDLEASIRLLAYLLWEAEGRPDRRADEYWHRACERVEAETRSAYPPTQSRGHRT